MKFAEQELVFLNSITGGGSLFGLPLCFPVKEKRKQAVQETIKALMEKELLKEGNILTESGGRYARALKEYREAKKHIILNYVHAAIISEEKAILILPADGKYDLYTVPVAVLAGVLLDRCPAGIREPEEKQYSERQETDRMLEEISRAEDSVLFGCFQNGRARQEKVYYSVDKKLYQFDFHTNRRKQIRAKDIRNEILKEILPQREKDRMKNAIERKQAEITCRKGADNE